MRKIFLVIPIILLAVGCNNTAINLAPNSTPIACTQEAKLCPDGSYVGRSGPNCQFTVCPEPKATTTTTTTTTPAPSSSNPPVACPQIAMACPDGSFVHPEGPDCKIPSCPTINSGIQGTVTLGPTCPVQRVPPDPNCADKPYQATIIVKTGDGQKEITRFTSKADGSFKQTLKPGTYLLVPVSAAVYPRGSQQTVTVGVNIYRQITISYDTGIR